MRPAPLLLRRLGCGWVRGSGGFRFLWLLGGELEEDELDELDGLPYDCLSEISRILRGKGSLKEMT